MHAVLEPTAPPARSGPLRRLWNRELEHYPSNGPRFFNLALVVLITIVLYYEVYLQGGVSTHILREYNISFTWWVNMAVIGYVFGALAALFAGLADRYGRANIVVGGLLITALLSLLAMPNVHSKLEIGATLVTISFVEGIVLVATPALIRDFSPQLGRASAMSFWTLGPVVGSLVVSLIVSHTSDSTPWQDQYIVCGIVGVFVWLIALFGLRELTPALRDQLMVSARDRALLEARAKGIDVEGAVRKPFRHVLKFDIVGSAFAIAVFLIIYYLASAYFPIFFQTAFGFSQATANSLGNWFWALQALALLVAGALSDRLRVRKPFMLVGAIGTVIFTSLFALSATHTHTSYSTFVILLVGVAVCVGITYAPWMASFTETVERRNPALTATGLAVWGMVIRFFIALTLFMLPHAVTTVTTLVSDGPKVKAAVTGTDPTLTAAQNAAVKAVVADPTIVPKVKSLAAQYAPELATGAKLTPATKAALAANPTNPAAQAAALSEISGVPTADVVRVMTIAKTDASELATARAIDPATRTQLLTNSANTAAQAKAVSEIASTFHIAPAAAAARLGSLASLPAGDLAFMSANGPKVTAAVAQLTALSKVPAADRTFLTTYGTPLKDPKVQQHLLFLQAHGPAVKKAASETRHQWQTYFWVAVGGQIVFIPLIFLMAGYWSPRRARQAQREHDVLVATEMEKLVHEKDEPSLV